MLGSIVHGTFHGCKTKFLCRRPSLFLRERSSGNWGRLNGEDFCESEASESCVGEKID